MILKVKPASGLKGTIHLPASKSYSIRAFMIAACGGTSVIIHPSDCDDARVAISAARCLGADITHLARDAWRVKARQKIPKSSRINVGESGTVLRFLLPLLAVEGKSAVINGEGTLRGRPNTFLLETLRARGVLIRGEGKKEGVPIRLKGGRLKGGEISIQAGLSSQFISALLIASAQLKEDTHLVLKGPRVVSTDYITMTLQVLKESGIAIRKKDLRNYYIGGNQNFQGLKNFVVPSDYGLAAFWMGAAVLHPSDVVLKGVFNDNLLQADGRILSLLKRMGARFQKESACLKIQGPYALGGGDFSLKDCPDLVPIMAVLALFAKGRTRLYNIRHARVKESDRISDLRGELLKIGAKIVEEDNELLIYPREEYKGGRLLDPHRDHRLAMAFAVLGTKLGVSVKDIECVSKSYPAFIRDLKRII